MTPTQLILIFMLIAIVIALAYLARTLWHEFGQNPKIAELAPRTEQGQIRDDAFQNEIDTPTQTSEFSASKLIGEMIWPSSQRRRPDAPIPHEKVDLNGLKTQGPSITWFGHSSYLLTMDGCTVLVDPVMSGHSSPLPFFIRSFAGTDVYRVEDLPEIDVLLITHDHYDHLDFETIVQLKTKVKRVVTTLGVGAHLQFWGYDADIITELNWHESAQVKHLTFTATPTRHFSGRSFVRNQTLWAAFVLKTAAHNIYIGGDSGYGPHFKTTGEQYGPFDIAILESGQYNSAWKYIHMAPEETVQAALDLRAQTLFPVHWGKFILSLHDWDEPIARLTAAAATHQQAVLTPTLGRPVYLNGHYAANPWWQAIQTPPPSH